MSVVVGGVVFYFCGFLFYMQRLLEVVYGYLDR